MSVYQLVSLIHALVNFYEWLVIIWCLMSWFPIQQGTFMGDVAQVINNLVSPFINLFRRFIPPLAGIDFSPMVAIFALYFVERIVIQLLYSIF